MKRNTVSKGLKRYRTLLANSFSNAQNPAESAPTAEALVYTCGSDAPLIIPRQQSKSEDYLLAVESCCFSVSSLFLLF